MNINFAYAIGTPAQARIQDATFRRGTNLRWHDKFMGFLLLLCSCNNLETNSAFKTLPNSEVNHHLIAIAQYDGGIRARGFSQSVPPNAQIVLKNGKSTVKETASPSGRFDLTLPNSSTEAVLEVYFNGKTERTLYNVKSIEDSLEKIVGSKIKIGNIPNDLQLTTHNNILYALVPASGDGELQTIPIKESSDVLSPKSILFPPKAGRGSNPYGVSRSLNHPTLSAVTLYEQSEIALVDYTQGISLSQLLPINGAIHPTQSIFIDNYLLAIFENISTYATKTSPAKYTAGQAVLLDISNNNLSVIDNIMLPCDNPTSILLESSNSALVVCVGIYGYNPNGKMALVTDGAIVKIGLDHASGSPKLTSSKIIDLAKFGPGHASIANNKIIVGSTVNAEIAFLEANASSIGEAKIVALAESKTGDSILGSANFGGGLVALTDFTRDRIIIVDAEAEELNPWPFTQAIRLTKSGDQFRGAKSIAFRDGRPGVDYVGYDGAVVMALSAELIPFSLLHLMGP